MRQVIAQRVVRRGRLSSLRLTKIRRNLLEIYGDNIWGVDVVDSQTPDFRANAVGKLKRQRLLPQRSWEFSRHTDMADLDEENTSEQETPALTEAISAILSEVKALKEQVTTLKESVELVEADPEVEESVMGDENNDDIESLSTRVARLGSSPAEQTKDGTKSLLQDIASELDLSERTDNPVDEGLAKIVLSLLKDKLPEEKSQARIDKYSRPENVEGLPVRNEQICL